MLFDITAMIPLYLQNIIGYYGKLSGTLGLTGAKNGGSPTFQCGSEAALNHPTFSTMPTLKKRSQVPDAGEQF